MNLTEDWLLANGISPDVLGAALGRSTPVTTTPRPRRPLPPLPTVGRTGPWIVIVPGWRPTLANELRRHPQAAGKLKRRDAEIVRDACAREGVTEAKGKRRVGIDIQNRYGRFPDADAPIKVWLDSLVVCGALVDDSDEWVDWTKPVYRRGEKRTLLMIEDVS
jgi:hypothetical protein